jgi:transposase InsO family protein
MIKEESNRFSLRLMCRLLSVSVSGYYAWLHRKPSLQKQREEALSKKIKAIFDDEKGRVGAARISKRLNHAGESVGKHRVARIMRKNGWRAKAAKKFKATTHSHHQ